MMFLVMGGGNSTATQSLLFAAALNMTCAFPAESPLESTYTRDNFPEINFVRYSKEELEEIALALNQPSPPDPLLSRPEHGYDLLQERRAEKARGQALPAGRLLIINRAGSALGDQA